MTEIRKYRIDIENIPFIFNDKGIGISLFDVATAYIGAYLLDVIFRLPNKLPIPCKNTRTIYYLCLLYTSPSPRDGLLSRMPSSA